MNLTAALLAIALLGAAAFAAVQHYRADPSDQGQDTNPKPA